MFDAFLPKPKHIIESGGIVSLPTVIMAEPMFETASDVFLSYVRKDYNVEIIPGSHGIRLQYAPDFPEEGYHLTTASNGVVLTASTSRGMNRALSTLLQMTEKKENGLMIPRVEITDAPDSPYRGVMLDLTSTWHDPDYLFRYVDLCWRNRASHFQLHLTDNNLFTLPLSSFPKLPNEYYSPEILSELVKYADDRGIILVPEVDVPGHTLPWMKAYPELFGTKNVLAASDEIFDALRQIFSEVHSLFPHSPWIHIGGDEADTSGWDKCPITQDFMKKNGIANVAELYAEYVRRTAEIILSLGCTPVVWEGFAKEYNDRIPKETIVIAWESLYQLPSDIAAAGFTMINCSWEPLYICTDDRFWQPVDIMKWNLWTWRNWWERSYAYPDGITIPKETANVIGGQICVWGTFARKCADPADYVRREFDLTAERLPCLCERTWNT